MTLQQQYDKAKGKQIITKAVGTAITNFLAGLLVLYGLHFLWNYLAPTWGLPNLTYLKFLGSIFFIGILKNILSPRRTFSG